MYGALWGMWGVGHGWLWSGGPFLTFLSLGMIVLGLWLVIGPVRPWTAHRDSRALEILAERYAAGELSAEEYQERLERLRQEQAR